MSLVRSLTARALVVRSLTARGLLVASLVPSLVPLGCAGGGRAPTGPTTASAHVSSYATPVGAAGGSAPVAATGVTTGGATASEAPSPAYAGGDGDGAKSKSAPSIAAPSPASKSSDAPSSTTITTTTTVTVNTPVLLPPPVYADDQGSPTGGLLTAAIWDDDAMRPQFTQFLARYPSYREQWGLDLSKKVTIVVGDANGVPVGDAPVALRAPNGQTLQLRTHGDGTALLFPTAAMQTAQLLANENGQAQQASVWSVAAQVGSLRTETAFSIPQGDTTWTVKLAGVPVRAQTPALDVAIVLDTTGSMGDEITYLQNELVGVMQRVKKEQATRRVRLGLVLYKDRGDEYVTRSFPFTEDLQVFLGELKQASAGGGGDMPESVNVALSDTIHSLQWAGDETGRLAILVADAPPHFYEGEQYTYRDAATDLSARGIKLVTLGASGIDKTTEYVFRELSAFTGGRYVFLTDDSGIGDSHLVPDITGYQVEHLDRILVRVIRDEARSFQR